MAYLLIVFALLMPMLGGCALLGNDVPAAPQLEGQNAQVQAWRDAIRRNPDGSAPIFVPLRNARQAVEAAQSQDRVNEYDAQALEQAQAALADAQAAWDKIATRNNRPADALAHVADRAHDAERLAQIAQYTAVREIGLDELNAFQAQQNTATSIQPGTDPSRLTDQQLINKRVVPELLGSLQFQPGSARLTDDSRPIIDRLAQLVQAHPQLGVAVFGFTHNAEPASERLQAFVNANPNLAEQNLSHAQQVAAYRQGLSDARARDVAQLLVRAGVDPAAIGARGLRDQHPVASNDTPDGRRQNERAEAIMIPREAIRAGRNANGG